VSINGVTSALKADFSEGSEIPLLKSVIFLQNSAAGKLNEIL